jgi:hypothetical protein
MNDLTSFLTKLAGGFLKGKGTIFTGLAMIILGVLKLFLPDLPIEGDPVTLITGGAGFVFLRRAIKNGSTPPPATLG